MATIAETAKESSPADELGPVLTAEWVLKPRHLVACVFRGALILYINSLPLLDSSIWLDVVQGRWILEHGTLPATDPAQPLTDGMRIVHTSWLAQVAYGLADRSGGPRWVSNLFAVAMLGYLVILGRIFYIQTRRVSVMLIGIVLTLLVGATFDVYASAEVFGQLCFVVLLWVVTRIDGHGVKADPETVSGRSASTPAWLIWTGVIVLFALWANLHGSYLLGIAVLACYAAAAGCEVVWKERSLRALLTDEETRRRLLLAEAALFASFLNPYGPLLLVENATFLQNQQLMANPGWITLGLASPKGVFLLASVALLAFLMRAGRREVRVVDVLLLTVFGAATVVTGRAQGWYALVYAFVVIPYAVEIVDRWIPVRSKPATDKPLTPRSFVITLLCGLAIFATFRLAPASRVFLGGDPRDMGELVGSDDLVAAADYLREHPAKGLIYAKTDWSDYLAAAAGPQNKMLMTSNVQWVPRRIWSDHRRMASCEEGWEKGMDRYAVDILVLDKELHGSLIKSVTLSVDWRVELRNDTLLVARRLGPAARRGTSKAGAPQESTPVAASWQHASPRS
ncbi:MAG: hypothetical protein ACYC6Y_23645 [Thermoguttaceae bacterium]